MSSKNIKDYIVRISGIQPNNLPFFTAHGIDINNTVNRIDQSEKSFLYDRLKSEHQLRLDLYTAYLSTYYETTAANFIDYEISGSTPVTYKLPRLIVNKHTNYLMNKGFLVETEFKETQDFLQEFFKENNFGEKEYNLNGIRLSLLGGITGDCFLFLYFDEITKKFKIDILEPYHTFPTLDKNNKIKDIFYYKRINEYSDYNDNFEKDINKIYEGYLITKNSIIYVRNDKKINEVLFDLPVIPVYHIQNFPNPTGFYGVSDLYSIIDLNTKVDRLLTNLSDIIDYHSNPITIIKGAKQSELYKGANRVWFLPSSDSEVYNLGLDVSLSEAKDYLERLIDMMLSSSYLNRNVFGKESGISNTPSSSLALTLNSVYEYLEIRRITYGTTFINLSKDLLKMAMIRGVVDVNQVIENALNRWNIEFSNYSEEIKEKFYPFSTKIPENKKYTLEDIIKDNIPKELYNIYITWYPPFNRDEKIANDIAIANINSGLWSKRHARSFIGMNEKESILMDREIKLMDEVVFEKASQNTTITNKTGLEGLEDIKSVNQTTK